MNQDHERGASDDPGAGGGNGGGGPDASAPPCPSCGRGMTFTGLPDVSGPIYVRIYRCPEHGPVRVDVPAEAPTGDG